MEEAKGCEKGNEERQIEEVGGGDGGERESSLAQNEPCTLTPHS